MSLFSPVTMACPNCRTDNTFDAFHSVNADRRADLKAAILAGAFQRVHCTSCGVEFRLEPSFNYLDVAAGLWVSARPIAALAHWQPEVARADAAFALAYGDKAGSAAREIGARLAARITFGWPAMREKIVIRDAGLDDVGIEAVKLAILRNRPGNPLAPGIELRLIEAAGDTLTFAWMTVASNEARDIFGARRALYDALATDPDWAETRASLSVDLFVDIQRMFITSELEEA